jgi:hypothetical protein
VKLFQPFLTPQCLGTTITVIEDPDISQGA